jgi:hypothetical protein
VAESISLLDESSFVLGGELRKAPSREIMLSSAEANAVDDYKFAIDVATAEQQAINERIERLDTKTGVILGFVIVSVAEILGFLLLIAGEKNKLVVVHPKVFVVVFAFALTCVLIATVLGCWEMFPRSTHQGFFLRLIKTIDPALRNEDSQVRATLLLLEEAATSKYRVLANKARLMMLTVLFAMVAVFAYVALVGLLITSLL